MVHIHSIMIIKKGNKYLNIYDKRWNMLLFPNIKGNNPKNIIKYIDKAYHVKIKENDIKLLFTKTHKKYSIPDNINKDYNHFFYEVNSTNIEGKYYTLSELLSNEKVYTYNKDIIKYIENYYSK